MAIPEYNYIPEYTRLGVNNKPKDVITASYWNGLFNALSHQGDHTAEELGNVLNHFTAAINDVEGIAGSKYVKPTNGIPKTDLAAAVQTSLDKADTALQTHQSLAAYRTAEAQDLIDNTKQDKLIAGDNITIAADGKTISATGSAGASGMMLVTITDNNGTLSADKSYNDIENAIIAGTTVLVDYGGTSLPLIGAMADSKYFGTIMCGESIVATSIIEITLNGEVNDISAQVNIPTTLPNPHAITFTGAVTGSYDGSAPMTVKIPSAVTDAHINSLIDTKLGVIENGSY